MSQYELPTNTCWYCHEDTMVECKQLGEGWLKCTKCGATYFPLPKRQKKAKKVKV